MSLDQARQMAKQVSDMALEAGLTINFDRNIPANTFNAYRLIQLAAKHNLQDLA